MKRLTLLLLCLLLLIPLAGCVDQRGGEENGDRSDVGLSIPDNPRIVTTSMACTEIADKLGLELVGIPHSDLSGPPKRYEGLLEVGMAMTPDMEIIVGLDPDLVLSPVSLISDLMPKYENMNLQYGFLNLNNVSGMYKSIEDLGTLLGHEAEANALVEEYETFMVDFNKSREGKPHPKVLVLMGLPGSYVVATPNSYVGDLVRLAGGDNVYADSDQQFININVEDMLQKDPDIILRTAHALPEEVMEMFAEEFKTNDTWKHFRAVENGKVYDLNYDLFGMSAKFNYPEGLKDLEVIFDENS